MTYVPEATYVANFQNDYWVETNAKQVNINIHIKYKSNLENINTSKDTKNTTKNVEEYRLQNPAIVKIFVMLSVYDIK